MPDEFDMPLGADEQLSLPQPAATARTSVAAKAPRAPADSFRHFEAWIAMQIARMVARGQRVL
jgi:hypothetical protein